MPKIKLPKDIVWKNYNNVFSINNYGQLRIPGTAGQMYISPKGYRYFIFCGNFYRISRIVAELFVPNPDNKPCVNHKNGIKKDDRAVNLEWCTYSENNYHSCYVLNNDSQHPKKKVEVYKNGVLQKICISVREAARLINGDHSNISKCCIGKRKQYLGYTFKYHSQ